MIVPTKGIHPKQALLTVGGEIIEALSVPRTVSGLWSEFRDQRGESDDAAIGFDWFVLALDLVRAMDVVTMDSDGFLVRVER